MGRVWAVLVMAAGCGLAFAQGTTGQAGAKASGAPAAGTHAGGPTQGMPVQTPRVPEVPIEGFTRRDAETIAVRLPGGGGATQGKELLLHGFLFNGDAVPTSKLHLHQIAPGVLEITSLAYSVGDWEFLVGDQANFYGTGERFDVLNRAHTVVRNLSEDNAQAKGSSTYKPMPFFMSTTGYGLWVDTTGEASFDFNTATLRDVVVTVPAERLRIVLFTTPEFPKMLENFSGLTERAVVPPKWAFAPWLGRDFDNNAGEVMDDVKAARAAGLPTGVLLIDSPWATAYNSYKWNTKQFNDPAAMVKGIHEAGLRLVLWHTPWINTTTTAGDSGMEGKIEGKAASYDEAAGHGYFVKRPDGTPWVGRWWKGEGSLVDFSNPAAKQWWQEQVRGAMLAGADGFKDDDGEGSFQGDVVFADKTPRELMRNRYALLYNNAVEEVIAKDRKGDGVLFARSVTEGANGIGFLWGGDNQSSFSPENGLPTAVTAGLNAGMSGMPLWTADLGGYLKSATAMDAVLLSRWTEFAAFSPVMEILSQTNKLPWMWDEAADTGGGGKTPLLDLYRRYAVLHMSLFPYRYAAAKEAEATGMPVMRALPLLFQDDAEAREASNEYMFGPALLVAPVVDRNTRRPVYLPEGEWVDWWTGAVSKGRQTVLVEAPVETAPVWARRSAVLAEIPADVMTLEPAEKSGGAKGLDDRRVYEVVDAAGAPAAGETAKDDEGRVLERGAGMLTIGVPKEEAAAKEARLLVRWRFGKVASATVDGRPAKVVTSDGRSAVECVQRGVAVVVRWQ